MKLGDRGDGDRLAAVLGCKYEEFSIKYLGLPLGAKYKDMRTWDPMIEMFERRLTRVEEKLFV